MTTSTPSRRRIVLGAMTLAALAVIFIRSPRPADAQCVPDTLIRTLNNPEPAVDDVFGFSVAVSGNVAVVGAPQDAPGGVYAGTAYVFDASTGEFIATLTNPTPRDGDKFGFSVAVSGDVAVVGAPYDDPGGGYDDAGTAYVFNAATGALIATLNNPAPMEGDYYSDAFGASVAVSGNVAVVGAPGDDPGGVGDAGTAYVFNAMTGELTATLANPSPTLFDDFGNSVAVSGNVAVVAASGESSGAGTAYVFNAATGALISTLNNPSPAGYNADVFGNSVAVSGNVAVVAAEGDDPPGVYNAGTAYVFNAATGALISTLNNPSPEDLDYFGYSVAVSGNVAVVGAFQDDPGGVYRAGTAYVFDAMTGALTATLNSPAPAELEEFGLSVAVSGNVAVVGAQKRFDQGGVSELAGVAYTFSWGPRAAIRCHLLNGGAYASELDLNGDGVIDIADLIAAP